MFGLTYIAITAFVAWRWRSNAAYAALPALVATVGLFWADVSHAGAYASAIWCAAGAWLIYQGLKSDRLAISGEYVAGALYGISGIVYVAFYLGASNATLSIVPVISDLAFAVGLFVGTWPNTFVGWRGHRGRAIRRTAIQIAREDLARSSMCDRG